MAGLDGGKPDTATTGPISSSPIAHFGPARDHGWRRPPTREPTCPRVPAPPGAQQNTRIDHSYFYCE